MDATIARTMECPRCNATQPDPPGADCVFCGNVFTKWAVRQDASEPERIRPNAQSSGRPARPGPSWLVGEGTVSHAALAGRVLLFSGFLLWSWQFVSQPIGTAALDSFLHLPNLVFHEAGHILFRPFGRFMSSLGGCLTQLLIPTICLAAFLWQN